MHVWSAFTCLLAELTAYPLEMCLSGPTRFTSRTTYEPCSTMQTAPGCSSQHTGILHESRPVRCTPRSLYICDGNTEKKNHGGVSGIQWFLPLAWDISAKVWLFESDMCECGAWMEDWYRERASVMAYINGFSAGEQGSTYTSQGETFMLRFCQDNTQIGSRFSKAATPR